MINLAVAKFIEAGVDVNILDKYGFMLCHYLAASNRSKALKHYLDNKVSVEVQSSDGNTPLELAILRGARESVDILLSSNDKVSKMV